MAKLKDISDRIGLSVTQVSRALNGYPDVSIATRERVLAAARELNYSPNLLARKLARGRSGMVALVRPYHDQITTDTMFIEVVMGLSLEFAKKNMHFLLHVAPNREHILAVYDKLIAGGALDGFVVAEPFLDDARIGYLRDRQVPFVVHGRTDYDVDYAYVDIDNYQVGYQLTKMAIDAGHRRIALIIGFEGRGYNQHRADGYRDALNEAGLAYDPNLVQHDRMTEAYGARILSPMLAHENPPTAFVCGHIRIAAGIYGAAKAAGLRVPDDIAVAAHDDEIVGLKLPPFDPPLARSLAPVGDSWAPMAEFLDRLIGGELPTDLQQIQPIRVEVNLSIGRKR